MQCMGKKVIFLSIRKAYTGCLFYIYFLFFIFKYFAEYIVSHMIHVHSYVCILCVHLSVVFVQFVSVQYVL